MSDALNFWLDVMEMPGEHVETIPDGLLQAMSAALTARERKLMRSLGRARQRQRRNAHRWLKVAEMIDPTAAWPVRGGRRDGH